MNKSYLSLGSNIGDRVGFLDRAIALIDECSDIEVLKKSSFYETDPQGYIDQDRFINCVIGIETSLNPEDLLIVCQEIEQKLKRKRLFRWGPRTIDIDILLYEDIIKNSEILTIPHQRMTKRAFVMVPLAEIEPSYKKYLKDLKDQKVRKI